MVHGQTKRQRLAQSAPAGAGLHLTPFLPQHHTTLHAARGANYAQQVVISPNSAHYWPDTLSTPNFTCSVANENLSGGAIAFTLTVDAALNATQITNDQQDAAQSLFDACCGGTSACPAWKAAATRSGAAALLDLCLMDGSICDSSGNLVQLNLEGAKREVGGPCVAVPRYRMELCSPRRADCRGRQQRVDVRRCRRCYSGSSLAMCVGEALLCPFPGETLAKFQKLQFLYLGSNSLTVRRMLCQRQGPCRGAECAAGAELHALSPYPAFRAMPSATPSTSPTQQGDIGNIATALLSLVSLHELRLNANTGITGTLTSDMCVLASSGLTLLDLARTGISGSLPGCLFGADSGLLYLAAGSTGLSGTLPDTFSAASTLWQLKLGVVRCRGVGRGPAGGGADGLAPQRAHDTPCNGRKRLWLHVRARRWTLVPVLDPIEALLVGLGC